MSADQSLIDLLDGGPGSGTGTAGRGRTAHVRHTAGHTCITDIVNYAFETYETTVGAESLCRNTCISYFRHLELR
jgi:hypothetical protein